MDFTLATWKQAAADKLQAIGGWLDRRRRQDAPYLLYGTLCGLSLWPLIEAAQAGQFLPVMMALGSVAGGVGGNLLAEQVQRWKDHAGELDEAEVADWAAEQAAADPELRQALDAILEKLEAIPQAQAALATEERDSRAWFVATLRDELVRLGSQLRLEATVTGSGAIAQGSGAQAAGERGVAARDIGGPVLIGDRSAAAGRGGAAVAGNGNIVIAGPVQGGVTISQVTEGSDPARGREQEAARRYLHQLRRLCNALPLAALAEEGGPHQRAEITLNRVYITLNTTSQVPLTDEEKAQRQRERPWRGEETRPLPALEAAAGEPRLVLLGDPGSGKSTFVNYLAYLLAGVWLEEAEAPAGWPHGPLLPMRILLRELTAFLPGEPELRGLPAEKRAARLASGVWNYVRQDLAGTYRAEEALATLERAVDHCQALIIFDGLDEVAPDWRAVARAAVEAFCRLCGDNRVLVTSRTRSYREDRPLLAFADVTLAPFDEDQIGEFVQRWYQALAGLGTLKPPEAERRAENLRTAVGPLLELARNPLLLTTMAVVHTAQVELPRERARLYQRCVDVLLRRWHQHKAGESPLLERLGVSEGELLAALRDVAFQAHTRSGGGEEGDLLRSEVLKVMAGHLAGEYGRAEQFLNHVDTRAGLLVGRGGAGEPVYTFPHRTFQEYLAGCHLALGGRDLGRRLRELLPEGDRWALAARLGAEHLLHNVGDVTKVLDAAYALCPVAEPRETSDWRGALWAGHFAVEVGQRRVEEDTGALDGGQAFLARLIPRLVGILREERLGAIERAAAGRVLARLGDLRSEVMTIEGMHFCYVPPGPFWMGGEGPYDGRPLHLNECLGYGYWIGRYPVTNAQFQAFVDAGGYRDSRYWPEARQAGVWNEGQVRARNDDQPRGRPCDFGEPFNLPNHPVVGVTWYEMLAFTRWLTERLRRDGLLLKNWEVRLPSEAEWEKAARGGVQVPVEAVIRSTATLSNPAPQEAASQGNTRPKGGFPWGDEADPNQANYVDTGIGSTSAVGCFPGGASPYGAEDMSGNVWEWLRSIYAAYPYEPSDGRENPKAGTDADRVLRGGAFDYNQGIVRCAYRSRSYPNARLRSGGMRVVVVPV